MAVHNKSLHTLNRGNVVFLAHSNYTFRLLLYSAAGKRKQKNPKTATKLWCNGGGGRASLPICSKAECPVPWICLIPRALDMFNTTNKTVLYTFLFQTGCRAWLSVLLLTLANSDSALQAVSRPLTQMKDQMSDPRSFALASITGLFVCSLPCKTIHTPCHTDNTNFSVFYSNFITEFVYFLLFVIKKLRISDPFTG